MGGAAFRFTYESFDYKVFTMQTCSTTSTTGKASAVENNFYGASDAKRESNLSVHFQPPA